jgi:spermidine/putrescine transport system permease protein
MRWRRAFWPLLLGLVTCFLAAPLAVVLLFSITTNQVTRFPIEGVTVELYARLLSDTEFLMALQNSFTISLPVALIATLTGTLLALGVGASRRSTAILSVLATPAMLPPLVVAVGLVVLFVRWLGLPLGFGSVIAGHVLLTQPLVALIVAARLAQLDPTLMEAARDLGATRAQAFWRVKFPQMKTAVVGAGLIAFAISLDEFIVTVFTIGSGNTLSTFVWGKMRTSLDPSINAIASASLMLTLALTAFALVLTRRALKPNPH